MISFNTILVHKLLELFKISYTLYLKMGKIDRIENFENQNKINYNKQMILKIKIKVMFLISRQVVKRYVFLMLIDLV